MKKVLVLFLITIGFAFLYQGNTKACVYNINEDEAIAIVEKANELINNEIEKAIEMEASLKHDHMYDKNLDIIIDVLIFKTNTISEITITLLENAGYDVECEYQIVIIGERVVYVDPIRVHSW